MPGVYPGISLIGKNKPPEFHSQHTAPSWYDAAQSMRPKMQLNTLFLVLSLTGLAITGATIIVKWMDDRQKSEAKSLADKKAVIAAEQAKKEAKRMDEVRQGELRTLMAARAEVESMRKVIAQQSLSSNAPLQLDTPAVAIEGLDKVIEAALREVSVDTAEEMKRLAQEESVKAEAIAEARQVNAALSPRISRTMEIIQAALSESQNSGLVEIIKDKKENEIPNPIYHSSFEPKGHDTEPKPVHLRTVEFKAGFKWTIFVHTGANFRRKDGPDFGFSPHILIISCPSDSTLEPSIGDNVFYLGFENVLGSDPAKISFVQQNGAHLGGRSNKDATKEKLKAWGAAIEDGSLTTDNATAQYVVEALKESIVAASLPKE